jgi:KDO2-lipid IV(A) lauroyltransferase
MYYLIYPIFYLFSLLPFFILYSISDFFYALLYYVFGYRKEVVMSNISIAFPEKSEAEKTKIAKQFYKNFVDTLIETVKMISMSTSMFEKRCTMDTESMIAMAAKGKSIQLQSGHQMNWEYANWIASKNCPIPFIGIYQKISNAAFNKLFYTFRSKFNTVLVSTTDFKNKKEEILTGQYALALAADQNTNPEKCFWLNFFSKPAPFVTGPAIGAIKNNTAIIFVNFIKPKRGYYHFEARVMVENANEFTAEQLTLQYKILLEAAIHKTPDNYLWTHRRWRHEYKAAYSHMWIDTNQPFN